MIEAFISCKNCKKKIPKYKLLKGFCEICYGEKQIKMFNDDENWTWYCDVWKCKRNNLNEKIYIIEIEVELIKALCTEHHKEYYPELKTKYIIEIKENKENGK